MVSFDLNSGQRVLCLLEQASVAKERLGPWTYFPWSNYRGLNGESRNSGRRGLSKVRQDLPDQNGSFARAGQIPLERIGCAPLRGNYQEADAPSNELEE